MSNSKELTLEYLFLFQEKLDWGYLGILSNTYILVPDNIIIANKNRIYQWSLMYDFFHRYTILKKLIPIQNLIWIKEDYESKVIIEKSEIEY